MCIEHPEHYRALKEKAFSWKMPKRFENRRGDECRPLSVLWVFHQETSTGADESIPGFPEAYLCCDWAPRALHSTTYWSWAVPTAAPLLGGPQDFKILKKTKKTVTSKSMMELEAGLTAS